MNNFSEVNCRQWSSFQRLTADTVHHLLSPDDVCVRRKRDSTDCVGEGHAGGDEGGGGGRGGGSWW